MEIKNLVFDVGNVLLEYQPMRFLCTYIKEEPVRQAVLEALFHSPEWPMADEGLVTDEELTQAAVRRAPAYEREIRRAVRDWDKDLREMDGMRALLGRLHGAGYGVYLLSNFSQRFHQLQGHEELFGLVDGKIISSDCRLVKPDRRIYELLLTKYGLNAGECLFIDDLPANVEGAKRAGMRAHLFVGREELEDFLAKAGLNV